MTEYEMVAAIALCIQIPAFIVWAVGLLRG
jgi:hypothetical protein